MTIKIHDLKPAPGSNKRGKRVGRGIGGQGRQDRRPRHQGPEAPAAPSRRASRVARCRCTCGCPSSRASTTRSGSSTRPSTSTPSRRSGLDEITPEALHAKGLTDKGALVKVLGRGELTRKVTVKAHAVLEGGRGRHHRGRRYGRDPPPAVGRSPPAGQGQPVRQPLSRRSPRESSSAPGAIAPRCALPARLACTPRGVCEVVDAAEGEQTCFPACGTCSGSPTCGTRSSSRC